MTFWVISRNDLKNRPNSCQALCSTRVLFPKMLGMKPELLNLLVLIPGVILGTVLGLWLRGRLAKKGFYTFTPPPGMDETQAASRVRRMRWISVVGIAVGYGLLALSGVFDGHWVAGTLVFVGVYAGMRIVLYVLLRKRIA